MAFNMKGFSPFTRKTDPVKKPVGPVTGSTMAEYGKRQVWNLVQDQQRNKDGQDIVKPKEEQIKDLKSVGGNELLDILDELVNGITRCKIH